jgi:CRISPR type III-A-associated protein Csm2
MRDRRYSQPSISPQSLPRIKSFYTSDNKIRPELLDSEARDLGKAFAARKGYHFVSSTQLRRYYNDVKQLQFKIERDLEDKKNSDDPEALKEYLPLIKMLKAKVAYGTRPGTGERLSKGFKDTMDDCIGLIENPKDFQTFVLFFESVVGYYYGAGGGR